MVDKVLAVLSLACFIAFITVLVAFVIALRCGLSILLPMVSAGDLVLFPDSAFAFMPPLLWLVLVALVPWPRSTGRWKTFD